ncbi:MAG: hypothetical protein ACK45W_20185 [Pseudanabaena sp.]
MTPNAIKLNTEYNQAYICERPHTRLKQPNGLIERQLIASN